MYDWFIRDTLYFSMHCCFITNTPYLNIMYIRYDQYWQIAYPKFLVEHNGIKMVSWNISIFWRKLLRFWGKFSSTSLLNIKDTFFVVVKYCMYKCSTRKLTSKSWLLASKKYTYFYIFFFMQFCATKNFL